jgi:hypothetical protein
MLDRDQVLHNIQKRLVVIRIDIACPWDSLSRLQVPADAPYSGTHLSPEREFTHS